MKSATEGPELYHVSIIDYYAVLASLRATSTGLEDSASLRIFGLLLC